MKALLMMLLVSFGALSWDKLSGYPESVYTTQGSLIDNGDFPKYVELAYAPSSKLYGITFYNYAMDEKTLISGSFNIRACGHAASGKIKRILLSLDDSDYENFTKILICPQPIFVKVYDQDENSGTYRIPAGGIKEAKDYDYPIRER